MKINIDVFYLLCMAELFIILLVLTVFFFVRTRKFKKLYENVQKNPVVPVRPGEIPEVVPDNEIRKAEFTVDDKQVHSEQALPAASIENVEDGSSVQGNIRKLNQIVDFQKNKILDLMGYKDLMESASKKLTTLQQSNEEFTEKIRKLAESSPNKEDFTLSLAAIEDNNNKMSSFISIMEKENSTLSDKFVSWEENLKGLWEQAESGGEVDEGLYSEAVQGKDELVAKLKEFEEQFNEKQKTLNEMQQQYDELETEYMVLYRQQQAADAAQTEADKSPPQ
jgi:chromosome segregation ATPase